MLILLDFYVFLILIACLYKKAFAGIYLHNDFFLELREVGGGGAKRARPPPICHI